MPLSLKNRLNPRILVVIGAWALIVIGAQVYAWYHGLRPDELLHRLLGLFHHSMVGPLIFVGAAMLSPLLLLPAALLGGVAGLCFGPALGVLYTLVGCNLSALLTYGLGRLSCRKERAAGGGLIERHAQRLRRNGFVGVVLLRLSFLPYDPVNYLIGLMRVPWPTFLLANTVGSLPGVIAIVLAGTSLKGLNGGPPMIDPALLLGAVTLLLLSVVLAWILRARMRRGDLL